MAGDSSGGRVVVMASKERPTESAIRAILASRDVVDSKQING
jgi:hypothetical protein